MCRIIFFLLLMATIMPYLIEAPGGPNGDFRMKCYEGPESNGEYEFCSSDPEDGCFSLECDTGAAGQELGRRNGCGACSVRAPEPPAGCTCVDCKTELCNKPKDKAFAKCYEASNGSPGAKVTVTDCLSDDCFLMKCSGPSEYESRMGCGTCPDPGSERHGCQCTNYKGNFSNQPNDAIKECYSGQPKPTIFVGGSAVGYELGKEECMFHNNDACQTKICNNGNDAQDYEKSCGKCPAELEHGCKCNDCIGELCNQLDNKGNINQCFTGPPVDSLTGKFKNASCNFLNNDACRTFECGDGKNAEDYYKSCGKCTKDGGTLEPYEERYKDCPCTPCTIGALCNTDKPKGTIKQCFGGDLRKTGKFEVRACPFFDNYACRTVECEGDNLLSQFDHPASGIINNNKDIPYIEKSCGKCAEKYPPGCKCTECVGDMCNDVKEKGSIKQCVEGTELGKFKPGNCSFYNNDACFTSECNDGSEQRGCGKCPAEPKKGCKCSECTDEMCNKEVFVDKCYWGDDQKGYEALTCKADSINNKACKKVKCLDGDTKVDPETGLAGNVFRDCGKCTSNDYVGTCKCFECHDKDLCNGVLRIGSTTFLLIMIGGVVALVASKPLVGIGI